MSLTEDLLQLFWFALGTTPPPSQARNSAEWK